MFKFYLRQTVPFAFSDIRLLFNTFGLNKQKINQDIEKKIKKITQTKYIILSESMRSVLTKSLEFFLTENSTKNEILLPEYSFHSNLSSAIKAGFTVKFVPINNKTLLIDEKKLEKFITKKTLGLIITHIHGRIYNLDNIKQLIDKYHLVIFEDCAHSFPLDKYSLPKKKQSNSNVVKCLSFGPGKFITAFGGGALATSNKKLFEFVKLHTIQNKKVANNFIILIKFFLYLLISQPIISYFTMKPILALSYLLKNKKNENYSPSKSSFIITMSSFQKRILFLELSTLSSKINKIILKRKQIAQKWSSIFKNKQFSSDFCFQFPISVDDPEKFIWQMWLKNIDVQKDYCSYLPKLMNDCKPSPQKKSIFFEKIVYLPTNQYLSNKKIEKKFS